MRSLIIIMLLLGSTAANAAGVTVDFDELPAMFPVSTFDSKGYRFTQGSAGFVLGTNFGTSGSGGLAISGAGSTMTLLGGGTFALQSFDMRTFSGLEEDIVITGYFESGEQITRNLTITGSYAVDYELEDVWQGLVSLQFDTAGSSSVYTDNIVTNAVPVPAAVWLFGSALAGLGWLKRKQTV